MTFFLYLFAVLLVVDAVVARSRLAAYGRIEPGPETATVVSCPEVTPPSVGAGAWLDAHDLDLVYLVPERVDAAYGWRVAHAVDVKQLQSSPITLGVTAGHAFAIRPELAERAGSGAPKTLVAFARAARDAKAYVGRRAGVAVVPGWAQVGRPFRDRPLLEAVYDMHIAGVLYGFPITMAILLLGALTAPWAALVALGCYFAQLPIALAAGPLKVSDLGPATVRRLYDDAVEWWALIRSPTYAEDEVDPIESRRDWYRDELAQGVDRFRQPPATTCYVCAGTEIHRHLTVPDLFQSKPGAFSIGRCAGCGHLFQDPQLTGEGLGFYYRDFYDGLGAAEAERGFVTPIIPYESRTKTVTDRIDPQTWLDVGCGHGHWCRMAAELVPDCRFEGLDQSDGVDVALRRGWVSASHRGAFPEVAPTLTTRYDVVSMSHYLEHTTDPRAELTSAAAILQPAGVLFIEVPEPTGPFARYLRGAWLPWLQPQHLHLFSAKNLERLLVEAGFEPLDWLFGEAHHQHDFSVGVFLFARRFAPKLNVPWRPAPTAWDWLRNGLVWSVAGPFVVVGGLLDVLWTIPARKLDQTSTMRVLARKKSPAAGQESPASE